MNQIIGFIKAYYHEVNKPALLACTLFISLLIWLNYQFGLEYRFVNESGFPFADFSAHLLIYTIAFYLPWFALFWLERLTLPADPAFWLCLLTAPAIFALKVGMNSSLQVSPDAAWNDYWNDILYWPLRMVVLLAILALIRSLAHKRNGYYGLSGLRMKFTPYILMLLMMIPLIAAASTQPDFLAVYPKMNNILPLPEGADPGWFYKLLFELSYGTDFFSVEVFFRGFLVVGFIKWAGKAAILPMACFYCTIHFGKPLGECISSFFGGLLLGIVSANTGSIYGGLIVHLGIAWLMELGGYIGNNFF